MDKRNCMFCPKYYCSGGYEECEDGKLQACDIVLEKDKKIKLLKMKRRKNKESEVCINVNTSTTGNEEYKESSILHKEHS